MNWILFYKKIIWSLLYLVVVQYSLGKGLVQHFAVPVLQALGFGDFLVGRVTVEDIVITFTRWTCPDVRRNVSTVEMFKVQGMNGNCTCWT